MSQTWDAAAYNYLHDEPGQLGELLRADLEPLLAAADFQGIFALAPRFAALDTLEWGAIRNRIRMTKLVALRDLDKAVAEARRPLQTSPQATGIVVNNRGLEEIADEAVKALVAANAPPRLFRRSGQIVTVAVDEKDRPQIQFVTESFMRNRLARAAKWVRVTDTAERKTFPPSEVVRDILAQPADLHGIPTLAGLTETPVLRPDGTILAEDGYDEATGLFYSANNAVIADVPETISRDDLDGAVAVLDDVFGEFPFVDAAARANLFALLLTPVLRHAINGPVPLALLDAPQAGSGKSLMAELFSVVMTGRKGAMSPYPDREEEMEKRIGAALAAGRSAVIFDNVEGRISSPTLALVLTSAEYETRRLGVSEMMTVPNRQIWLATGNNIHPSGDLTRRCYWVRIDAQTARPHERRDFKHKNLVGYATAHRGRILHALLLMAAAWWRAGRRVASDFQPMGSFEAWSIACAGTLANAGVEGFLANRDELFATADQSEGQWEGFLRAVKQIRWGSFTAADLASDMGPPNNLHVHLPDSLAETWASKRERFTLALGHSMRKRRDRRYGAEGWCLQADGSTGGSNRWVVTCREA